MRTRISAVVSCSREQREQRDRPELAEGGSRDRQLAEDGSPLAGVGEDWDDESEGGG